MDSKPGLTVVICTHNRAGLLKKALNSLFHAEEPAVGFGVLVVANCCTDDTEALLDEQSKRRPRLRWLRESIPGKSHALNRAISALSTPVAVFIDDDQRVAEDFLLAVEVGLERFPNVGILCGRMLPDWDGTEPGWVHDEGPYRIYPPPVAAYDIGPEPRLLDTTGNLPPGGNLIIRREVFDVVGTFDTQLGPRGHDLVGGEDQDFLHRAITVNEKIAYVPDIIQYHTVLPEQLTTGYLIRKSYRRTRSALRLESCAERGVPLYLWKKLLVYGGEVLISLAAPNRRRFYLVRLAAAAGEIRAMQEMKRTRSVP